MPLRKDIHTVLVIGSGPIVIGQACEFDYSGTQACQALREANIKVVLVNSNPATIMTDTQFADRTYIEPLTPKVLEEIILREKVDAILPTMGGQTALNLVTAMDERGFFRRHPVKLIGANIRAIKKAEDRDLFKRAMENIGMDMPRSGIARSVADARKIAARLGFPLILRPSFTLGGTGAGIAKNPKELDGLTARALELSPAKQVLIEESLIGWKEFELEVIRDPADNVIVICSIENLDPMGVHTGDSVTVAPAQTLSDEMFQVLRDQSKKIIREIGVDTGGSNIQFAIHPKTNRVVVIEMNPRVSRSSALASKATGYPIAKVAARLALGLTLDEIVNDVTGCTPASFEPSLDYVVTKMPRFAFEKFVHADETLNTQMKSVGEVMSIGRNFKESLQKAVRGLEIGRWGLGADGRGMEPDVLEAIRAGRASKKFGRLKRLLDYKIVTPNCDRLFSVKYAIMMGESPARISRRSGIDPWFIDQIAQLVDFERRVRGRTIGDGETRAAKLWGYSDAQIAWLTDRNAAAVRRERIRRNIVPVYSLVDTCAAEFSSVTPYYYSTYAGNPNAYRPAWTGRRVKPPVMILGGGPNRIGQGIEFDYCCVHAAMTLRKMGRPVVMVNCNPETVSTDPNVSDRLYFEPLTSEDVLNIVDREKPEGVIVQFGGQTPLNLCADLARAGVRILGTSPADIDRAEDRKKFDEVLNQTGLLRPENGMATTIDQARAVVNRLGFPVLIRPSYVLGGLGMEIIFDQQGLDRYLAHAFPSASPMMLAGADRPATSRVSIDRPILIDQYLRGAIEIDVDAVSDGRDTAVIGILEHVEEAGVHSGDAACFYPPLHLTPQEISDIREASCTLAKNLRVRGLINIQFALQDGTLFVLEVNPRASRTVPFVSKACGVPLAAMATRMALGANLRSFLDPRADYFPKVYCVKESVFPFLKFSNTDIALGPQMRSTGEVMGMSADAGLAFAKSQEAAGFPLALRGRVLISVQDRDKPHFVHVAHELSELGFSIMATPGTAHFFTAHGVRTHIMPRNGVRDSVLRMIREGALQMFLNTFRSTAGHSDFREIRRAAMIHGVPVITTVAAARCALLAIRSLRTKPRDYHCLQDLNGKFSRV